MEQVMARIRIPNYSASEEVINSVSHGIGALLGIAALVLMVTKAQSTLSLVCGSLFGASMILTYATSCVYHAVPATVRGKGAMRVLDHCNVFLLVFGTYLCGALLGVGGVLGWVLFGVVAFFTAAGIVLAIIDVDRYGAAQVVCHLISGWSILIGVPQLLGTMGLAGFGILVLGGVVYSAGAALYAVGKKKPYMHSVFHVFCLAGTFFQFWAIYAYLL